MGHIHYLKVNSRANLTRTQPEQKACVRPTACARPGRRNGGAGCKHLSNIDHLSRTSAETTTSRASPRPLSTRSANWK
eukprot:12890154-Ditylum_brightwellii.AAC.1